LSQVKISYFVRDDESLASLSFRAKRGIVPDAKTGGVF